MYAKVCSQPAQFHLLCNTRHHAIRSSRQRCVGLRHTLCRHQGVASKLHVQDLSRQALSKKPASHCGLTWHSEHSVAMAHTRTCTAGSSVQGATADEAAGEQIGAVDGRRLWTAGESGGCWSPPQTDPPQPCRVSPACQHR